MLLFRWALGAALLTEMGLCPRLWQADRSFPTVGAFPGLPELPPGPTLLLLGLFVAALAATLLLPRPRFAYALVGLGASLALFDVDRMQPWFYQALLLFLGAGLVRSDDSKAAQSVCAAVLAATYVWSGLQKANLTFATQVFPWLLHPLGLDRLHAFWFVAPILETSIGVLLIFPRTRNTGLVLALAMHAFLLAALGPIGQNFNSVVWPWNLWMPILCDVLFFRNRAPILPDAWRPPLGKLVVVLAGVLPALNFAGWWDDALSASLYSGRSRQGFLLLNEDGARRLPPNIRPYVQRRPDRIAIDLVRWALADLNVPPYPEARVYAEVAEKLEAAGVPPQDVTVVVTERPGLTDTKTRFRVVKGR